MKTFCYLLFAIVISSCGKEDEISDISSEITDQDGNVYTSVEIGSQVWMVENLKTTKYSDGTPIPNITDSAEWDALTTPAFSWYDNDEAFGNDYGALYNGYVVETGKVCPTGWHVPSSEEFSILIEFNGGVEAAGAKLEEAGNSHWVSSSVLATNESGFTGLPGGGNYGLDPAGQFHGLGAVGYYWGSVQDSTLAFMRLWQSANSNRRVITGFNDGKGKSWGRSVRCLKD